MILWQQVETIFRKVPKDLASTRLVELEARAAFMRNEVLSKARAASERGWMKFGHAARDGLFPGL